MDYKDMNAIGIVRLMLTDGVISQEVAGKYFPELKESKEEKKKRILYSISIKMSFHLRDIFTEEEFQCFNAWSYAWLKKQGEQKSADEIGNYDHEEVLQNIINEQKPADLPNGEDYGIDGLWNAIRILETTLGKVDGYQTDDGILEHKCAISAVKNMYEQKSAWSEKDKNMLQSILDEYKSMPTEKRNWLKSLKDRMKGE